MRLHNLINRVFPRPRTIRRLGNVFGRLEQLECRTLPSVNWIGGSADWSASVNNWLDTTDSSHHLPTTGDDVVIDNGSAVSFNTTVEFNTLTLSAASSLSIGSGTLTIDNNSTLDGSVTMVGGTVNVGDAAADIVNAAHFTLSSGTLGGPGTLNVTDTLIWSSGIMQGSGMTHVANTATFALNGNNPRLDTRTLTNDGTATTSVNGGLEMLNGALFDNNGTLTATNQSDFNSGGTFRNDGTFIKTGAGTTTRFNAAFNNNGTVNVVSGTLDLGGSGTSTGATFAIGSGTTLFFSVTYTVDAASSITGAGAVEFRGGGTVTVNGSYTITGATTISNTTNFNTPTTFPTLNLSGKLGGSGNVLIASALNWTGNGTMVGVGTTTVANNATLTMTANNTFLDGRTVINNGSATLSGAGSLSFQNGAVFDNNGAFTTTGSFGYANGTGGGAFHNNNTGSFTRIGTGSTTTFGLAFTNDGTVDVQSGTMSFTSTVTNLTGGTLTGGTWIARDNTTLLLPASVTTNQATVTLDGPNASSSSFDNLAANGASGVFTIQNGRSFTPTAAFDNAGLVNIGANSAFTLTKGGTSSGDWNVADTGALNFKTGTYLLDDGTDITGAGPVVVKTNGTVNVGDAAADVVNISNLIIGPAFDQGTVNARGTLHVTGRMDVGNSTGTGFLSGSGNVTVGGLLTLFHGAMAGPGTTSANGGLSLQIGGGGFDLKDGRHLDNNATGTWTSDPGQPLGFKNGAIFNNNGTFDIQVDSQMANGNLGGDLPNAINNAGTFTKNGGNGTTTIGVPLNNNGGTLDLQTGTLTLRGGGTSIRPWTVAAGATLDFAGGAWNLDSGSTISGEGTVRFEFATVDMADTYSASHTEILFGAKANFNADSSTTTLTFPGIGDGSTLGGSGNFTVNGLLTWITGTIAGAGTVFAKGDITLSGNSFLTGRTLDLAANHTLTWQNGSTGFTMSDGAVFNNNGTFDVQTPDKPIANGGGATSMFINNGTFKKSAGTNATSVQVLFNNAGTIDEQSGTLSLTGGLTNFPAASMAAISSVDGATESGTMVTITTPQGHGPIFAGQKVTISGVNEAGYNGTFTITTVPNATTFQYTAATSGLPNSANGSASFLSTSTLTGGNYLISGIFQVRGADVVTNAANIVLDGSSSAFLDGSTLTDALANLATNAATGSFTLRNGRTLTTTGDFLNNGAVAVQSGGTLTTSGSFSQTAGGLLNVEIAGTAASQFGHLAAAGDVNLDGALNVSIGGGFVPAIGATFVILNKSGAGAINGAFSGLAEGDSFNIGKSKVAVTYLGGSGNDFTLTRINLAPTLDSIADPSALLEDANTQPINLNGITAGSNESQTLKVTATSSNTGLIPNPTINYTSSNSTGTLFFKPAANQSGTAVITVTVTDDGGTAGGGIDTFSRTFAVTVNPVNDAPTLDAISDPPTILSDDGLQTINLTGITAGGGESQTLTVTATSSNPSLIPDPSAHYNSPDSIGTLSYAPVGNQAGSAVITVTVTDNGDTSNGGINTFTRTFTVTVAEVNNALTSSVAPLPAVSAPSFTISWSGHDNSGVTSVAAFDVFVSTDGGPFALFQQNTTATSALFNGELGRAYAFVSAAIDSAGHRERLPSIADAVTRTPLFQRDLPPIAEDTKLPAGVSVTTLLGTAMSDADPGALRGIAVTGLSGSGTWQFSADGKTFKAMPAATENAAWLLPDSFQVRFVPAANFVGTAGLLFRGWDRTWGTAGTQATVPAGESASPFSDEGGFARVQVTPVNDRPVLPTTPAPQLLPTPRSPAGPAGQPVAALLGSAIDVDGDALGVAIVGAAGTGSWQVSLDGGTTFTEVGKVSSTSALLLGPADQVRFIPNAGATGQATLTVKAWDQTSGQRGTRVNSTTATATAFSTGSTTAVTKINSAPSLTGTGPALMMPEDQSPNAGFTVSALLAGRFHDDVGAAQGVAITGADGLGHGTWFFSTGGTNFKPVGAVSDSSALLLRTGDKLRFVPNADFNGTSAATLTYRAWDQTFGSASSVADVLAFSTGTFFSNESLTASLDVTPVADRPVLDTSAKPALPSFLPGGTPTTARVADLIAGRVHDADHVATAIAVTGVTGAGAWEFSLDGGATFAPIGKVSATSGRLLNGDALLRFTPTASFRGMATISFKVWDETVGTPGALSAIAAASTAFSKETGTATVAVNTAPVLNGTGAATLPAIAEDAQNPAGIAVSTLLGTLVTDADGATVPKGIAVTGLTGSANGTWQFSTVGAFAPIGAVADSSALLLRPTDKLRFVPNANFHGQATVTFRAWDQTVGAFGSRGDASVTGGASAFSDATRTATVTVTSINDAPLASAGLMPGKMHLPSVPVSTSSPTGVRVEDLVAAGIIDADGNALGIAVSGLSGAANGLWQFSTDGTNWQNIGVVSASSSLLLAHDQFIRFAPNAGFVGSAEINFRAWDQTKGVALSHMALTSSQLAGSLSVADFLAPVWVNTRPVLTAS